MEYSYDSTTLRSFNLAILQDFGLKRLFQYRRFRISFIPITFSPIPIGCIHRSCRHTDTHPVQLCFRSRRPMASGNPFSPDSPLFPRFPSCHTENQNHFVTVARLEWLQVNPRMNIDCASTFCKTRKLMLTPLQ